MAPYLMFRVVESLILEVLKAPGPGLVLNKGPSESQWSLGIL